MSFVSQLRRPAGLLAVTALTALTVTGGAALPAAAATDVTAPALTSLSAPAAAIDVTTADGTATITAHATDAGSGVAWIEVETDVFTPDPASTGYQGPGGYSPGFADLSLVSGTDQDGVWQGSMDLPAGDWGSFGLTAVVTDVANNQARYSTAQLTAKGLGHTVKVITTRGPAAPTKIHTTDVFEPDNATCALTCLEFKGQVFWTQPAGPGVAGIKVDSTSSACGKNLYTWLDGPAGPGGGEIETYGRSFGLCTVVFEVENGFASTGKQTVSYF